MNTANNIRIRLLLAGVIWLMTCTAIPAIAQNRSEGVMFRDAVGAFLAGRYVEARTHLEGLLASYPSGSLRTAASITLAKTHYRAGHFRQARKTASGIVASAASRQYVAEASLVEALSHMELGQVGTAWALLDKRHSPNQSARSDSVMMDIVRSSHVGAVPEWVRSVSDAEWRDQLELQMAGRLAGLGRLHAARRRLESLARSKNKAVGRKATETLKAMRSRAEGHVRVGVITSLSGANSETGDAIRQGLRLAVSRHNASKEPKIELVIYDDQSDILSAIEAARDMIALEDVSVIIGPIESDLMAAVSVVCEPARLPVVSCTAARPGLTDLGTNLYLANPDLHTRSSALADHAVRTLKGRKFAILAPSDYYGEAAVRGFSETVTRWGGRIVAVERYYENTQDFRAQMIALRRAGFVDSVLDGRVASLNRKQIDSVYAISFPAGVDQKEEFAIPMDEYDGLFLPVYSEDIKYVAPQIAFYNLKTQLLGGDQWFDLTELKLQQNYVNGVVFVSESFVDPLDKPTQAFLTDFKIQFGEEAKPEAIYGYDLMQLLLDRMTAQKAFTGDEILLELSKGVDWKGIHNRILWPKSVQSNQSVHILKFLDGHIVHVK